MRGGFAVGLLAVLLVIPISLPVSAAVAATTAPTVRVIARAVATPSGGGLVRSSSGVVLYVPPLTVEHRATLKILDEGHGIYDFTISSKWHGDLVVTLPHPRGAGRNLVMHAVNGSWQVASAAISDYTVTVDHLSIFTTAWSWAVDKISENAWVACALTIADAFAPEATAADEVAVAKCLSALGIQVVVKAFAEKYLSKLLDLNSGCLSGGFFSITSPCVLYPGTLPSTTTTVPPTTTTRPVSVATTQPISVTTAPTTTTQPTAPPSPLGFTIDDSIYGGTWARTDPNDGTWYPKSTPPPNGAYWYPNGLGVAASCAESAASYAVVIYGQHETWSWWAHITDGKWVPVVVFSTVWSDGANGLPPC